MGFMDKAKKMAEQAQAKLDDAQKQFNAGQQPGQESGPAVEYDQHGRPIAQREAASPPHGDPLAPQSGPPAAPAPPAPVAQPGVPPAAEPPAGESFAAPSAEPSAPRTGDGPAPESPPARPERSGGEATGRDRTDAADEDRNNPSYAPPKLSSGDPLAG